MTRIRLAVVLVLSAFFSFPISAADGWMLSTEVDEMEDKEEVFALYSQQLENMSFEVKMRCLSNRLRLDVATFDGFLATTRRLESTEFFSQARVDLGDGNVTSIFLSRSRQWGNLYWADISVERVDGYRFRLELVTDNGTKHIVKGDVFLGSFVVTCKEQQKQSPRWFRALRWEALAEADTPGKITVAVEFQNGAMIAQPFPVIRVSLEDRFGRHLAVNDVSPTDYMNGDSPDALVPAGGKVRTTLLVPDPMGRAEGFRVDFCLKMGAEELVCSGTPTEAPSPPVRFP